MMTSIFSSSGDTAMAVAGQYFFYFMIYSFLGWVLEGTYNLYSNGSFRKEGFLKVLLNQCMDLHHCFY